MSIEGVFVYAKGYSAIFGGAELTLLACGGGGVSASPQPLTFRTIYPNDRDEITIPEGFNYNIVIRWGDALDNGPNLDWNRIRTKGVDANDVERQKKCFGYNCDFVGFLKTQDGKSLLIVNHEYCNPEIMFPVAQDGRVVIYMGDDERFEYVYKFITKGK